MRFYLPWWADEKRKSAGKAFHVYGSYFVGGTKEDFADQINAVEQSILRDLFKSENIDGVCHEVFPLYPSP